MKIVVPENVGGELRVLPEDTYEASIQDLFLGTSKANKPKITCKWVVTSEYSGKKDKDHITTIGENVLEAYSLAENAIWKLNSLYKAVTGNRLPMGDYTPEEFLQMLKDELVGVEFMIDVKTDAASGSERSIVSNAIPKPKKARGKK